MEIDAFWASRGRGPGGGMQGTFLTCREAAGRVRKGWGPGPQELHGLMPRNLEGSGGKDGKGDSRREKPGSDRRGPGRSAGCRQPGAVKWKGRGLWGLRAGLKRGSSASRPRIQGASGGALRASRLRSCPSVLPEPGSTAETRTLQPGWGRLWGARGVGFPPHTHPPPLFLSGTRAPG